MATLFFMIVIFILGGIAGYKLGYTHVMQDVERIVKVILSKQ